MKLAQVKKLDGTLLDQGKFEIEAAGVAWFQRFIDSGVYGQKYVPAQYKQVNNLISAAVMGQVELLDENQLSFVPPQFQEQEIVPAVFETVTVLAHEEILATYVIEFTDYVQPQEDINAEKIAKGKAAREVCLQVMDLITGFNIERVLTAQQISDMQSAFMNIQLSLQASRPSTAKALISLIEPDGELVTVEMKAACLLLLAAY